MDTSETYVQMSRQAFPQERPEGALMALRQDNLYVDEVGHFWFDKKIDTNKGRLFPLKSQDQLQEMVKRNDKDNYDWMCHLSSLDDFVTNRGMHGDNYKDYVWGFSTWEQLWLCYVMKKNFNKIWDKNDWVASP